MSAEKHTYSMKPSHTESKKIEEMKNAIHKLQNTIGVDRELINMIDYLVDKVVEGKTVSIVDQTNLWSVTQAAKELAVTRPTVYKMIERGDLDAVDLDGMKIVPSSAFAFLKRKELARSEALKKLHEINMKFDRENNDLLPQSDSKDDFEAIDL
jgi:excisionase family DNA binding protein